MKWIELPEELFLIKTAKLKIALLLFAIFLFMVLPAWAAPTITISTSPAIPDGNNGWFKTAPLITLSSSEPGNTYWYYGDGYPYSYSYLTPFTAPDGQYTIYYYSATGGVESAKQQSFKVDTMPPAIIKNVALNKPAYASSSWNTTPSQAFDGDKSRWNGWNSGTYAPAWIYVDLQQSYDISSIILTVGQYPDGNTIHNIYASQDASNWTLVRTLNGYTYELQNLIDDFSPFLSNVRYVKVETVNSPSWISWTEIEVYETLPPINPADSATGVNISTNITATFSEDMDSSTINSSTFNLKDSANNLVPGIVSYNASTKTAIFVPSNNLSQSSAYTAMITTGVTDLAGNNMTSNMVWRFTTEATSTNTHAITASAGANGSISPSGTVSVNNNGTQPFTITPNANYHVADVQVDGASVGAVTSYTFVYVTADHIISATFGVGCGGTITLSGNGVTSPTGPTQMYLSWIPSDIVGLDHYEVYDTNNSFIASTAATTYEVTNAYLGYYVKALDNSGNQLAVSNVIISSIPPCYYQPFFADFEPNDTQATAVTSMPRNNVPSPHYYGFIDNPTDEDWYEFYVYDGQTIQQRITIQATGTQVGWTIKTPDGRVIHQSTSISSDSYSYLVPTSGAGYYYMRVWNTNGNGVSTRYDWDLEITPQLDNTIPAPETNVAATPVSSTEIDLSWVPSTDNMGPVLYGILGSNQSGNSCFFTRVTKATSLRVSNLSPNTTYSFCVGVGDAGGNTNVTPVACASATTLSRPAGDTTPPTTIASPSGGTYSSAQTVYLNCIDTGGSGCQTTKYCLGSGCSPSTTYSGAINISSSNTLRFYSTDNSNNNETVKSEVYTINLSGQNERVNLSHNIYIIFSQVSDLCTSIASTLAGSPGPAPSGYKFMGNVYDVTTCADYTGTISVTIPYNQSSVPSGKEGTLRMFHWENGTWHDVTVSVDTGNNTIMGRVTSLSPFGMGYSTASSGGSGSGGTEGNYSTGANENMIALIAILAISFGVFLLRRHRRLRKA